ncbi:hypothetical protein [Streptomyces fulvoviolaceus]|uniref:hypothetical protein n=1 Tax=Streptomyces fulvoviolaceus TaxID=285535 RepID=UPI0021C1A69F|nr:hypothetical protein [Streptomyces fulvoviolaceus]MCT9081309.1 hypothetical protein [Streptomyces fulvoviolaceus]
MLNGLIGLAGIVVPVVAWLNSQTGVKNALLGVETLIVVAFTANHFWQRRRYIILPRTSGLRSMDDPRYYDTVRTQLERELFADYGEIADGHLRVYASEVPRLSALLVNTLVESGAQPARIFATDLTTNPTLLTGRREYLAANRRLLHSGGSIQRLYLCYENDLVREDFARPFLQLVDQHRQMGVTCGLAVRDRLRAEQAVDAVVFAAAAVLVEEEQGDADYTRGRSSVYFKGVERWAGRFESVWGHGTDSAPMALQAYESAARPLLDAGRWDGGRVKERIDAL